MSTLEIWLTLIGLALATVATRATFLLVSERVGLPARLERALRYAPACALAAIIAPDLFFDSHGAIDLTFDNARLIGAVAAAIYFVRFRGMLMTIVVGMVVFTLVRLYA
jgi:branched-subunit amino acid transport protein